MGRINLAALRVRNRAVLKFNASAKGTNVLPNWTDVVADIPPAQILTRQQPHHHPLVTVRTQSLPGPSAGTRQIVEAKSSQHKLKAGKKASKLFAPVEIKYEEDELRRQFFQDHPWELARPRIVLETDGNQYEGVDWSTGLRQKRVPLSGESVVQRQLWLLHNVPDITVTEAYDIVRREFYMLRRAEETRRRIAIEEAEHSGAHWEKTASVWGAEIENKVYDGWLKWSKQTAVEMSQKNSAAGGETPMAEQEALMENEEMGGRTDVFKEEAQRRNQQNYG